MLLAPSSRAPSLGTLPRDSGTGGKFGNLSTLGTVSCMEMSAERSLVQVSVAGGDINPNTN